MRIENRVSGVESTIINAKETSHVESIVESEKMISDGSYFAGDVFGNETLFGNKEKAKMQAMDIITKIFEGQQKVDAEIGNIEENIRQSHKEIEEGMKGLKELEKESEQLREEYGIDIEGEEHQEVELIIKGRKAVKDGSFSDWSKEEQKAYLLAESKERTEYQKGALEIYGYGASYREMIQKGKENILLQTKVLKEIHIEQLKQHDMVDAQYEADKILETASKAEVIDLMNKVVEKQEEIHEEIQKETEAMEEEKKEEKIKEQNLSESAKQIDEAWTEAQGKIEKILQELKLMEEDIKGIRLDLEI